MDRKDDLVKIGKGRNEGATSPEARDRACAYSGRGGWRSPLPAAVVTARKRPNPRPPRRRRPLGGAGAAERGAEEPARGAGRGACREPITGGTLMMARDFETQSLDPFGPADNGSIFARVQIFNTLVEADPDTLPEVGPASRRAGSPRPTV